MSMQRPDWELFVKQYTGEYLHCSCGQVLQSEAQIHAHWMAGHFDALVPDPPALGVSVAESVKPREQLG